MDWLRLESSAEDELDAVAFGVSEVSELSDESDVDALELEEDDCEAVEGSGVESGVLDDGTAAGVGKGKAVRRAAVFACWAAPAAN